MCFVEDLRLKFLFGVFFVFFFVVVVVIVISGFVSFVDYVVLVMVMFDVLIDDVWWYVYEFECYFEWCIDVCSVEWFIDFVVLFVGICFWEEGSEELVIFEIVEVEVL